METTKIAARLGTSYFSVYQRAKVLGVVKTHGENNITTTILKGYGFIGDSESCKIPLQNLEGCFLDIEIDYNSISIVSTRINNVSDNFVYIKFPSNLKELKQLYFAICGELLRPIEISYNN